MILIDKFLKNNFLRVIRNFFFLKPTFSNYPYNSHSTISDFFFWKEEEEFNTKFMLTNLSSQIFPERNEIDNVNFLIFDNFGLIIKELKIKLDPFETKEIYFSTLNIKGFGSFFAFHNFKSLQTIIKSNSFIAERGYVGYKSNQGVWNFMHGNKFAAYINKKKKLKSIEAITLRNLSYMPQVSFGDCKTAFIILNNPSNINIKYKLLSFDKNDNLFYTKNVSIPKFGTIISKLESDTKHLKLSSKLMLSRPVILKYYNTYFDIFHG